MTDKAAYTFDTRAAGAILPGMCELVDVIGNASDADAAQLAAAKATHISKSLVALREQAVNLPQGDLSVDDQAWLIDELKKEKAARLEKLRQTAQVLEKTPSLGLSGQDKQ